MKCFVVFLMTLAVVNSFPLKNDEDSSLKKEGNGGNTRAQELSVFQMEAFTMLFFTFGAIFIGVS